MGAVAAAVPAAMVNGLASAYLGARVSWSADMAGRERAIAEAEARSAATREAALTADSQAVEQLEALVVEAWALYGVSDGAAAGGASFDLLLAVRDVEAALRLPSTLTIENIQVEVVEARWPLRDSRERVVVEVVTGVEPAPAYLAEIEQRLRTAMDAAGPRAGA